MENLKENRQFYASTIQRDILLKLTSHPVIETSFFITGGTALSVFYLQHRVSDDLDLFSLQPIDLSELDFWIRSTWRKKSIKLKEGPEFLSFLIEESRVDFVVDKLSNDIERGKALFENGHYLTVDNLMNIASNKFCALASRVEPKDFIDFYFLMKTQPEIQLSEAYKEAKAKDAIFDDPPTAAYQLEEGLLTLKESPAILPETVKEYKIEELTDFYSGISNWLYEQIKK
jgi:predicted nucleotidyltransferase component of viral defense system